MRHPLLTPAGAEALQAAAAEAEPDSLAAVARLRERFGGQLGAAALTQESLRRKGVSKLGERAHTLLLTRDGLEQASRAAVARWHAERFVAAGVEEIWDLGCGIGADALAFADAGLRVVAVERDEQTAAFAAANLGERGRVVVADAQSVEIPAGVGVWLDPARRDARGRRWTTTGLSPSWEFTTACLRENPGGAKLGPGIAHRDLPEGLLAEWVSDGGDVVECGLWSLEEMGMAATRLPGGERLVHRQVPAPAVLGVRGWLGEPDGAAVRSACLSQLARGLGAGLVADQIAYLAADSPVASPWVTWFEVLETLPYQEKRLRQWVADAGVGILEIKVRGLDVDPAGLRRRLRPKGRASATLVLTPTPDGVRALVCRRCLPAIGE